MYTCAWGRCLDYFFLIWGFFPGNLSNGNVQYLFKIYVSFYLSCEVGGICWKHRRVQTDGFGYSFFASTVGEGK